MEKSEREAMTQINLKLPVSLHKKVKLIATENETTMSQIILEYLKVYISENEKDKIVVF